MKKLYSGRLFADHYQFYLLENNLDPDEWSIDWNPENTKLGYITNNRAISISTLADLNIHWIEVFFSETSPSLDECERGLLFNMDILSGELKLRSPAYEEAHLYISSGYYSVYILAYSLGKETEEELSDEELEQRTDLERYKIVLVPGKTNREGVIKGSKYLPDCIQEEEEIENV